jgi:ubiquinone/menaquinone biosynthesis C-methylase UbiE
MAQKPKTLDLDNDGERMIPEHHQGTFIYGEHIVRYEAAKSLVKGKVVLDIACGSGYGSHLLSNDAKKVYGVDVSSDAVEYAKKKFSNSNIEFMVGDAEKIPLPDNSVDIVITFETIEHIKDYRKFMSEIKRVLKEDGLAVISTPNDTEFSEGNHFHLHEFEHSELTTLISKYFKYQKEYFQGTWIYNALLTETSFKDTWEDSMETIQSAPKSTDKALYFYVLCSNRKITESIAPIGAISHHWSAREQQIAGDEANAYVKSMKDHIKHLENQVAKITDLRNANIKLTEQLSSYTEDPIHRAVAKVRRTNK